MARIAAQLNGDREAIRDVVRTLDPAVRTGMRPLPSPLPLVASITARYDGIEWSERDRDLLLALALRLDDALAPLLAFDGRSAEELMRSAIGAHLVVRAGRVRLVDPLLEVWLRATADPVVEASVHERLAHIFGASGAGVDADWHRARASSYGIPETAPELTRIARRLSESGHPDRALLLAAEAAAHATGSDLDEARQVAGAAAIGAGYAAEAAAWLGALFPAGTERFRLQGLGGLVVAEAFLQGAVPEVDPGSLRPQSGDDEDWYSWARAAAFAAVLSAERGDRRGMRIWLEALREGCARVGAESTLRDPVVTLAWLIAGEDEIDGEVGAGPLTGGMLRALRASVDGDLDQALRFLAAGGSGLGTEVDPFVAGFEHSPLVAAYRAVVEVLLLVWRGDLGHARERLREAALVLPVAMPFAGLGVVLARRLDLAVSGRIGPISEALTASLPSAVRIDRLVDHAVETFLRGEADEASSFLRLWADRGSPRGQFSVPELDELVRDDGASASPMIEPPDARLSRELMSRIAATADARWRRERDEIVLATRTLASPFSRARVESMLGTRALVRDEPAVAREHLQTALTLFQTAGAEAWARNAEERLSAVEREDRAADAEDSLVGACRRAWEPVLTSRELEVAMRAVTGGSNREIGDDLRVSVRTVEVHLGRVFVKLGVRNRVELTVLAHRAGRYS